ncbi:MAG: ABC transporter permease [Dehalococcoidales bacterium]|nr:MAG: ABC transporter permease [Dehalococcoidales bacterium]
MARTLRSYVLMLKWQALSNKPILPLEAAVQVMIACGFVIGLSFFYPDINPTTAKFLVTGAPTLILLMTGLVLAPQIISMARAEGTFDYIWSLPVKRIVYLLADATIWVLVSLPGVVLALIIGAAYHDFSLEISPLAVPALLLIALTGVFIGYAIAHGAPKPQLANLATQIIVFFIMIFSPVVYPTEQLPDWLATLHNGLPIKYMADLSRGTLTDMDVNLGLAFSVVGVWCVAAFLVTYALVHRRR